MSITTISTPARPELGRRARRFGALVLAGFALILSLAPGCDSGDNDPGPTPSSAPPETTAAGSSPVSGEGIIDLAAEAPLLTIWGADEGDFLNDLPGLDAGDVNGDGVDDLLIAARFGDGPDNARQDAGDAYLILGSDDLPETVDLRAGEASVTIYGGAANDQLGYDAILADVNGDGLEDILLGAAFARRPDSGATTGVVYVIFGNAQLDGVIDLSEAEADGVLLGGGLSDYFGDSLAAGDINGDGIDDILAGATFARRPGGLPNAGAQAGAAYAFFGGPSLSGTRDVGQGQYDVVIYGVNDVPHADELGDKVASGDINGDGIDDFIAGAEAADGPDDARSVAAEVHVVYGSEEIGGVYDVAAGDQDLSVWGAEQNDTLGFNIATGDLNGDGTEDLLMTARGGDGPANSIGEGGEVHVVFGNSDLPDEVDLLAGESDAALHGADQADMIGYGLLAARGTGDFDQLIVGSPFGDGPSEDRPESGEVYILDARAAAGEASVATLPRRALVYGGKADDGFGAAVTSGDLNGDGRAEVIVLAIRGDGPDGSRPNAGEFYVIEP
jgi:hypothetical protein